METHLAVAVLLQFFYRSNSVRREERTKLDTTWRVMEQGIDGVCENRYHFSQVFNQKWILKKKICSAASPKSVMVATNSALNFDLEDIFSS